MQLNFFRYFFNKPEDTKDNSMVKITQLPNGRFAIVDRGGQFLFDYARRRDAVRGAKRRGFEIA
jgi:hypothetical protein